MAMTKTEVTAGTDDSPRASDARLKPAESVIDRTLRLLSSVRFGIIMLILLLVCCMIGMLIVQQNVDGFREYYLRLTPAQRELYRTLGFFDIYHSWYFTLLLLITALNIVLSSIDRFPAAWRYLRKPRVAASPKFVRAQMFNTIAELRQSTDEATQLISSAWRKLGLKPRVSREENRTTVFGQRNAWNRLGAYVVHLALLIILLGGFLTSRYGVGGVLEIIPGQSENSFLTFEDQLGGEKAARSQLPFTVECTDLQQQLIRPEGGLDVMNTIDWLSFIRVIDEGKQIDALVHLNSPFDYRGYRFFQSSFQPRGNARQITVSFREAGSPERSVTIPRNGSADVEGVGRVSYVKFYPDFTAEHGQHSGAGDEYNNPAAELRITSPDGSSRTALALNPALADEFAKKENGEKRAETVLLTSFEKVATSHTLTVQYDPGRLPVYIGFTILTIALCCVFFISHQRVWAVIEPDGRRSKVFFGGHTNRNKAAFEARFNSLVEVATGGASNNE